MRKPFTLFDELEKKIKRKDNKFAVMIGWFLAAGPGYRMKRRAIESAVGTPYRLAMFRHFKWMVKNKLAVQYGRGFKAEYSATDLLFQMLPGDSYTKYGPVLIFHYGNMKSDPGYCDNGYKKRTN